MMRAPNNADASWAYHDGASAKLAVAHSSADLANLSAETKNTTFPRCAVGANALSVRTNPTFVNRTILRPSRVG